MVSIKDQYIHYDKVGDHFLGRSITGISFLKTEFLVSPVHWDWKDSHMGSKGEMVELIEYNL